MNTEFRLNIGVCGRNGLVYGDFYRSGYPAIEFGFPPDAVLTAAAELRRCARDWADKHWEGNAGAASAFEDLLQTSGHCFSEIFKHARRSVPDFLASAEGEVSLIVRQQSPEFSIPWGLLSRPNSEGDPRPFWAVKYNVHVNALGSQCGDPRPQPWVFASAFHDQVFANVFEALQAPEQSFARAIHDRKILAENFHASPSRPDGRSRCCFIYIHAHGESGQLVFVDSKTGGKLKVQPHNLLEALTQQDGVAFIVLNACNTVESVAELARNLLAPISDREIACIATEYPIDNEFAMRMGLEIIDRCVQDGESTLDAMKAVRRRHYPQSIAYALFCKQAFVVDPTQRLPDNDEVVLSYRRYIEKANFSTRSSL